MKKSNCEQLEKQCMNEFDIAISPDQPILNCSIYLKSRLHSSLLAFKKILALKTGYERWKFLTCATVLSHNFLCVQNCEYRVVISIIRPGFLHSTVVKLLL